MRRSQFHGTQKQAEIVWLATFTFAALFSLISLINGMLAQSLFASARIAWDAICLRNLQSGSKLVLISGQIVSGCFS